VREKTEITAAKSSLRTESAVGTTVSLSDVLRSKLCLSGQTMFNVQVYVESRNLLVIVNYWKANFQSAPNL